MESCILFPDNSCYHGAAQSSAKLVDLLLLPSLFHHLIIPFSAQLSSRKLFHLKICRPTIIRILDNIHLFRVFFTPKISTFSFFYP